MKSQFLSSLQLNAPTFQQDWDLEPAAGLCCYVTSRRKQASQAAEGLENSTRVSAFSFTSNAYLSCKGVVISLEKQPPPTCRVFDACASSFWPCEDLWPLTHKALDRLPTRCSVGRMDRGWIQFSFLHSSSMGNLCLFTIYRPLLVVSHAHMLRAVPLL